MRFQAIDLNNVGGTHRLKSPERRERGRERLVFAFKASTLDNTLHTAVFDVNVQDVRVTVDLTMNIPPP